MADGDGRINVACIEGLHRKTSRIKSLKDVVEGKS